MTKFSKPKKIILNFTLSFCLLIFAFCILASKANAAVLYLEPSSGEYYQGDTFIVSARIDTEDECINTVEANLGFSQDILEAVDFSRGDSILTLWLETPNTANIDANNREGLISFAGGIPGGYCGRIPGDPGESNLLGKIIFKAKEVGREQLFANLEFLESSQVLLNDGFGTPAELTLKEAVFTILPEKKEIPQDEWLQELEKDKVPPEPFEIEIHQDIAIFDGKYFIIFSTIDKQTGLDHYEVKEGKKDWEKRDSPYLLENQSLRGIIKVKAVDKAGSERIAEYLPPKKPFPYWIIVLILMGAGAIWFLWKKYMKKQK